MLGFFTKLNTTQNLQKRKFNKSFLFVLKNYTKNKQIYLLLKYNSNNNNNNTSKFIQKRSSSLNTFYFMTSQTLQTNIKIIVFSGIIISKNVTKFPETFFT